MSISMPQSKNPSKEKICLGLTEQGKIFALDNNVQEALRHYREALRQAKDCQNADLFFHHTTQCIMEILENAGNFDLVIEYCNKSEDHYAGLDLDDPLLNRQRGSNLERLGLAHILSGNIEAAKTTFEHALKVCSAEFLPISETIKNWLSRGYAVSKPQIKSLQKKHDYFIVNKADLRPDIAILLPPEIGQRPQI